MVYINNYMNRLKNFIDNCIPFIDKNPNVSGLGLSYKKINGKTTPIPSLTFFVYKKFSPYEIPFQHLIPKYINNVITDIVEESNDSTISKQGDPPINHPSGRRPLCGGLSVANIKTPDGSATLGYPVTDAKDKENLYFLSSANLLVDSQNKIIMAPSKNFMGTIPYKDSTGRWTLDYIGEINNSTELLWMDFEKKIENAEAFKNRTNLVLVYVSQNTPKYRSEILEPCFKIGPDRRKTNITTIAKVNDSLIGAELWTQGGDSINRRYAKIEAINYTLKLKDNSKKTYLTNQLKATTEGLPKEKTILAFKSICMGATAVLNIEGKYPAIGVLSYCDANKNIMVFSPIEDVLDYFSVVLATNEDNKGAN